MSTAIVTGGTRGLGLAIAERLARGGLRVAAIYRADADAARAAEATLGALAPGSRAFAADLADPDAVDAVLATIEAEVGPPSVLVNNAFRGGRPARKVHEIPPEAWIEDLASNLTGPFLVTRAVLPGMVARRAGRVVFIGSLAMHGERGRAAYVTAKAGLAGLSRAVALEYARSGITSNLDAGAFLGLPPDVREAAEKRVPVGRLGRADEVAELVHYLTRPEAAYVTGQVLGIDGGMS
jgi:NAD(P)-dependent dehydrogenase (short-subunit alcohol dehydrogenase family)